MFKKLPCYTGDCLKGLRWQFTQLRKTIGNFLNVLEKLTIKFSLYLAIAANILSY